LTDEGLFAGLPDKVCIQIALSIHFLDAGGLVVQLDQRMETAKGVPSPFSVWDCLIGRRWFSPFDLLTVERFGSINRVAIKVKGSRSYHVGLKGGLQRNCSIFWK
jgi:hypothetical protein